VNITHDPQQWTKHDYQVIILILARRSDKTITAKLVWCHCDSIDPDLSMHRMKCGLWKLPPFVNCKVFWIKVTNQFAMILPTLFVFDEIVCKGIQIRKLVSSNGHVHTTHRKFHEILIDNSIHFKSGQWEIMMKWKIFVFQVKSFLYIDKRKQYQGISSFGSFNTIIGTEFVKRLDKLCLILNGVRAFVENFGRMTYWYLLHPLSYFNEMVITHHSSNK